MASVHIGVRDSSGSDATAPDHAAARSASAFKLLVLWLAVLLPLAYGVFEQWQDAKALFGW
jgi:hypothetical protein